MWVSCSSSGGDASPLLLLPQQVGVLSVLIPHVCSSPAAIAVSSRAPTGAAGALAGGSVVVVAVSPHSMPLTAAVGLTMPCPNLRLCGFAVFGGFAVFFIAEITFSARLTLAALSCAVRGPCLHTAIRCAATALTTGAAIEVPVM